MTPGSSGDPWGDSVGGNHQAPGCDRTASGRYAVATSSGRSSRIGCAASASLPESLRTSLYQKLRRTHLPFYRSAGNHLPGVAPGTLVRWNWRKSRACGPAHRPQESMERGEPTTHVDASSAALWHCVAGRCLANRVG